MKNSENKNKGEGQSNERRRREGKTQGIELHICRLFTLARKLCYSGLSLRVNDVLDCLVLKGCNQSFH